MRKLFFLTALLCASVMGWADTQYCHEEKTNGSNTIYVTMQLISEGHYQLLIESEQDLTGLGGSFCEVNGVGGYQLNAEGHFVVADNKKSITCNIESTTKPNLYTPLYVLMPGEVDFGYFTDAAWGECGEAPSLKPSNLNLNSNAETLDADASQTFLITATTADGYDGTVTYVSSNDGIATVSSTGLVTAIGRGTATITVTAPATKAYAKSTKTFTATVTGSQVNWNAIDWVGNGSGNNDYTNKFKVSLPNNVSVVNIQSSFGTEAGIYLTFPDGVSACDFGDGNYAIQGAGMLLYVSKFTKKVTTVNVTAVNEYEVLVYYEDGSDSATAITNTEVKAKAVKVFENGQLVIIKNGVKYNALGAEVR